MDFQKATAKRIVELFDEGQTRVLLADEVGLGKTIIAREVVQTLLNESRTQNKTYKVVYVCSNINIAKQNCRKLGIKMSDSLLQDISDSRLSMQMLCLREQGYEREQLIPLTAATSFSIKGKSTGKAKERALIYCMLVKHPRYSPYSERLSALLGVGLRKTSDWKDITEKMDKRIQDVLKKDKRFIKDFIKSFSQYMRDDKEFAKQFKQMCTAPNPSDDQRIELVRNLRIIFSKISLKSLNPDLVIMDEFQRFKELINSKDENKAMSSNSLLKEKALTEQRVLAREFLKNPNVKVLLLSATPYKPYSTLEELCSGDAGNHYSEFMNVMDFLFYEEKDKGENFEKNWEDYSEHLYEIKHDSFSKLIEIKDKAEESLYEVICRTERRNDNIVDTSKASTLKGDFTGDIKSFIDLQKIMDRFDLGKFPVEYAKSAPYLMSFMNYQVKDDIWDAVVANRKKSLFTDTMYLKRRDIDKYKQLPVNNSRLRNLYKEVFGEANMGAEYLLWIPASKPYYDAKKTKAGKIFADNFGYTKTLVFSRWEMVPRVIAGLTSYESERRVMKKIGSKSKLHYFAEESSDEKKTKRKGVYQRITSENIDVLLYPSKVLADLYNPVDYLDETIGVIRYRIKRKIEKLITSVKKKYSFTTGKKSAAKIYSFLYSLDQIEDGLDVCIEIPNGIEDTLVDIAIGSPAVCAYRVFKNRYYAEGIASHIIDIFNKTETASILRALYGSKGNYYENVFKYCCEGNLQAVLDEYAFVLNDQDQALYELMSKGFISTANLKIETEEFMKRKTTKASTLRTHFAVGYYNAKISEKAIQRTENIRNSFNSPFKPFVLATTSIGQEGLDFHLYSRKVMHWNLPSNPIDIEQREGRVNRFMCHAIRQNLAENAEFQIGFSKETPIWETIVCNAKKLKGSNSDLVPFWCLPKDYPLTRKIERIVPLFPYSEDVAKYVRLKDILAMYRLTLGQPRQEELIDTINNEHINHEVLKDLYMNLSPWEIEKRGNEGL